MGIAALSLLTACQEHARAQSGGALCDLLVEAPAIPELDAVERRRARVFCGRLLPTVRSADVSTLTSCVRGATTFGALGSCALRAIRSGPARVPPDVACSAFAVSVARGDLRARHVVFDSCRARVDRDVPRDVAISWLTCTRTAPDAQATGRCWASIPTPARPATDAAAPSAVIRDFERAGTTCRLTHGTPVRVACRRANGEAFAAPCSRVVRADVGPTLGDEEVWTCASRDETRYGVLAVVSDPRQPWFSAAELFGGDDLEACELRVDAVDVSPEPGSELFVRVTTNEPGTQTETADIMAWSGGRLASVARAVSQREWNTMDDGPERTACHGERMEVDTARGRVRIGVVPGSGPRGDTYSPTGCDGSRLERPRTLRWDGARERFDDGRRGGRHPHLTEARIVGMRFRAGGGALGSCLAVSDASGRPRLVCEHAERTAPVEIDCARQAHADLDRSAPGTETVWRCDCTSAPASELPDGCSEAHRFSAVAVVRSDRSLLWAGLVAPAIAGRRTDGPAVWVEDLRIVSAGAVASLLVRTSATYDPQTELRVTDTATVVLDFEAGMPRVIAGVTTASCAPDGTCVRTTAELVEGPALAVRRRGRTTRIPLVSP